MSFVPALDPTTAFLGGFVTLTIAVFVMNRGDSTFVNLAAQDEPVTVAIGTTLFLLGRGSHLLGHPLFHWLGGIIASVGLLSRYTEMLDIETLLNWL